MRLLAILLIGFFTPTFLATNVFREEDFYLLQSTYDLTIYQGAIDEITSVIEKARKKNMYKNSAGSHLIFEDLQKRVESLRRSFETLKSPSFSTTAYLRKNAGEKAEEKYVESDKKVEKTRGRKKKRQTAPGLLFAANTCGRGEEEKKREANCNPTSDSLPANVCEFGSPLPTTYCLRERKRNIRESICLSKSPPGGI